MTTYENELSHMPEAEGVPVWDIIQRRLGIILFWIVVGVGLAYLLHTKKPVYFQSKAQIWVAQKSLPAVPLEGTTQGTDKTNIRTQELLLKSPLVLQKALEDPQLKSIQSKLGSNPLVTLSNSLTVKEVEPGSNVLELEYLGSHDGDSQVILDTVINSYQDYLGDTRQNVGEETRALITEAKDELLEQIREKEASYRDFKQSSPLLWVEEKGQNYFQERLQGVEADRAGIIVERKKLEAQLRSIEESIKNGESREAIMLMAGKSLEREMGETREYSPLKHLLPLYIERQDLLQAYGADHPKVVAVNNRIELTRQFLQEMDAEINGEPSPDIDASPANFLDVYVSFLEGQLRENKLREALLTDLFNEVQAQAKSLVNYESQDEAYRSEIGRLRQLFETVVKRVDELSLIKDTGGYEVSVLHPASADKPVQLHLVLTLALGGVLGTMCGYGLAYLIDRASRTFYSAQEVSQTLHLPLIGHVPKITRAQRRKAAARTKLDPMLYTHAVPKASISESFRAVRTALYFSTEGKNHRVVQVTSPVPGDGKSTLASNLAVTIAQSGKRTLLLDADFRKPRVHKIFQLPNDVGLASVIDGKAELVEAIQPTEVKNLSVMTCGKRPSNPSELLSSPRFQELLEVLREKYDYVLIDTPPMLAVTDASAVAPRVDSVILAIRLQKGVRPNAERASDMLRSLGANLLGVVVNQVQKSSNYRENTGSYYGYGGYRGGRRGYGYAYTDSYYGEEEDKADAIPEVLNGHPR